MFDLLTFSCGLLSSSLYAVILHRLRWWYEPRWTWLTVVVGVLIVLALVAVRFALPVPNLAPRNLVWWSFQSVILHFIACGIPIICWQTWQERAMLAEALDYRRKRL